MTRRTTERHGCLVQIGTGIGLGLVAAGFVVFMSLLLGHTG